MRNAVFNNFFVVCIGASMVANFALAQNFPDPTRPPSAMEGNNLGQAAQRVAAPVLQSILVSSHRHIAMIDGQMLKLGDKVGESRIIKITESEVVLRNGKNLQILKLFPGVEKDKPMMNPSSKTQVGKQ